MTRQPGSRPRRWRGTTEADAQGPSRRLARTPEVEPLEGRRLLSQFFAGPTMTRAVQSAGGVYTLTVTGGGVEKVKPAGHGAVAVTLFGTTPTSVLNVTLTRPRLHVAAATLPIASIRVASGQIGSIQAGSADLLGTVSPLNGSVNAIQFGNLRPAAQLDVNGSLGGLALGDASLGPFGHVRVSGDLGQTLIVGSLALNGGQFVVGHDLTGPLDAGAVTLSDGGQFVVGHDLTGAARVSGNLSIAANSVFVVGHNVRDLSVGQTARLDSGGRLAVGNDLTGALNVTGDLTLAGNAQVRVGRLLNALTVDGGLRVDPSGGSVVVGGDLSTLTVTGAFVGKGSRTAADLTVGLNLGSLNVLGGGAGQGGLQNANLDVAKDVLGLNIPHGVFNSFVTAGVLIDGGNSGPGGNIGPDGPDAVVNSEIRAGVQIKNITLNGNVRSTFAANPQSAGYRTRIIAGEDRQGNYSSGGNIDNFQITGSLIDSVLAASVAPAGGNGTLPRSTYGAPPPSIGTAPGDSGNNTYDAPAGVIFGGTVANPIPFPNYSELSYRNETLIGVTYNRAIDPTIDDGILPGAINASFAKAPLTGTDLANPVTVLPLPTKSTVLGGVISTVHGDEADFAGIFAADTRGVFVGALPQ